MNTFRNKIKIVLTIAFLVLVVSFPVKSYATWIWEQDPGYFAELDEEDCVTISKTIKLTAGTGSCVAPELSYSDNSILKVDEPSIKIFRSTKYAQQLLQDDFVRYDHIEVKIGDGGAWIVVNGNFSEKVHGDVPRGTYVYYHARRLEFTTGRCFVEIFGRSEYLNQDQGHAPLEDKVTEIAQRLIPELRDVCESADSVPPAAPPAENMPEVEALAEKQPIPDPIGEDKKIKVLGASADDSLSEAEKYLNLLKRERDISDKDYEDVKKIWGNYEAGKPMNVWSVEGEPEMQVPGNEEWVILKKGDTIPPGARIFTGMDDDLLVSLPGVYLVKVRSFTDITFNQTGISKSLAKKELINHLDLRTGDVEVHVEKGTYQSSMQVQMPQYVVGVRGTHFWVSYNEKIRLGTVGVFEGEVAVDDLSRDTRTLLTPANDGTQRVVVMLPIQAQTRAQGKYNGTLFWVFLVLILGGGVFALHKTGKLKPIIQKVLALARKDKSKLS